MSMASAHTPEICFTRPWSHGELPALQCGSSPCALAAPCAARPATRPCTHPRAASRRRASARRLSSSDGRSLPAPRFEPTSGGMALRLEDPWGECMHRSVDGTGARRALSDHRSQRDRSKERGEHSAQDRDAHRSRPFHGSLRPSSCPHVRMSFPASPTRLSTLPPLLVPPSRFPSLPLDRYSMFVKRLCDPPLSASLWPCAPRKPYVNRSQDALVFEFIPALIVGTLSQIRLNSCSR